MKSNSKTKVASLVTAALLALIALFGMTACPNNAGGNTDSASGGNTGGLELPQAPLVQGGASLILSPDKLTIKVKATTSDNSPITVEGCDKTELASGTQTELKAKGTKVVLKGKITNLFCGGNKLTALNVQGLNALQGLGCYNNQLTADAFIKLFNDLPQRTANEDAQCNLYTEQSGVIEGNHKDFTSPGELKTAFDNAKTVKKWKMYKYDRDWVEI